MEWLTLQAIHASILGLDVSQIQPGKLEQAIGQVNPEHYSPEMGGKSWAQVVSGAQPAHGGLNLKFIPPEDQCPIQVSMEDVSQGLEK